MAENRALLLAGLGLAGYAAYQLLQKPPAPVPVPPPLPGPTPPPTPQPAAGYYVTATAGLIVRAGPGTGYSARGSLPYQAVVSIDCQTLGEQVQGSRVWDRITGPIAGYVSDWWISTPNVGTYSPGLGVCPGGLVPPPPQPPPPPPPPALPPTGGAVAIDNAMSLPPGCFMAVSCGDRAGKVYFIESATGAQSVGRDRTTVPWSGRPYYRWKRLVKDDQAWLQLGNPWRGIRLVTSACRDDLAWGPDLASSGAYGWQFGGPRNGIILGNGSCS